MNVVPPTESMEKLSLDILRLGAEVCETVSRGTEILLNGKLAEGRELVAADQEINELSTQIELDSYSIMVFQTPTEAEMRTLIAAQKLVGELERSADLVSNICRAGRRMHGEPIPPRVRDVVSSMSTEAVRLLKLSLDSFADTDRGKAEALGEMDDVLDQLNRDMVRAVFDANETGELALAASVQLALVARYYERIGDHAVNIGERVAYIVTGDLPDSGSEATKGRHVAVVRRPASVEPEPEPADPSDGLEHAVSTLPIGLLVADRDGTIFFRNRFAELDHLDRQESVLIEDQIAVVVGKALEGVSDESMADFWGPPRHSYEIRSAPVVVDGVITGASVIVEDVTERRRMLDVRRDFVANLSHELRTPIGAVSVLAETLLDSREPEVVERLCARLHRESMRLGDTIEDLLTLSRLESGDSEEPEPVRVSDIIAAAAERVEQRATSHEVTMNVNLEDMNLAIVGDRGQLISAVGNLVDNAAKYSEAGASIDLSARGEGDWVVIRVIDYGMGIPESDLERIFERFYRVDPARSRGTGGTGLGLSIVRHVIQNHSGEIEVTSREGEGSTFTLKFPRRS